MITRTHEADGCHSVAIYSDCEAYRYTLRRVWDEAGRKVSFVMLNPSTATEYQNDPTVERCQRRAVALGFGAMCVTNIFAFRATDPKVMRAAADPIGPANDDAIREAAEWGDALVCAWGNHGDLGNRGANVKALLQSMDVHPYHLGLAKTGHPKHPLYIAYAQALIPWW